MTSYNQCVSSILCTHYMYTHYVLYKDRRYRTFEFKCSNTSSTNNYMYDMKYCIRRYMYIRTRSDLSKRSWSMTIRSVSSSVSTVAFRLSSLWTRATSPNAPPTPAKYMLIRIQYCKYNYTGIQYRYFVM